MNTHRLTFTILVVFVLLSGLSWLLHDVVLGGLYEMSKGVWRQESAQEALRPLLWVSYFLVSIAFSLLFARGYRGKGWAEGVRYGLFFGFAMASALTAERFVSVEVSARLALGWFIGTLFTYMMMGVAAALVYRHPPSKVA
jgi:hypothetical protein